jgi:hypothetical protein
MRLPYEVALPGHTTFVFGLDTQFLGGYSEFAAHLDEPIGGWENSKGQLAKWRMQIICLMNCFHRRISKQM